MVQTEDYLVNYHSLLGIKFLQRKQYIEAYENLLIAARLQNVGSRYNLGVLFEYGLGVEKSLEKAAQWYSACVGCTEVDYSTALQRVIRKKRQQLHHL